MTAGTASSPGTGYRVVLPPGWVRIPLREGSERGIDAGLEPEFAGLPTDSYGPIRAELRKQLLAQVEAARQDQGIDLYLPVEQIGGVTVAASVVVGIVGFPASENATEEHVPGPASPRSTARGRAQRAGRAGPGGRGRRALVRLPPRRRRRRRVRRVRPVVVLVFQHDRRRRPRGTCSDLLVELFDAVVGTVRRVHG